nr:hypothetical protein Iba_chr12cCG3460 [Ipomoea batatas]
MAVAELHLLPPTLDRIELPEEERAAISLTLPSRQQVAAKKPIEKISFQGTRISRKKESVSSKSTSFGSTETASSDLQSSASTLRFLTDDSRFSSSGSEPESEFPGEFSKCCWGWLALDWGNRPTSFTFFSFLSSSSSSNSGGGEAGEPKLGLRRVDRRVVGFEPGD